MEPKASTLRKVHIVYYLSRGGLMEQPHMLEVPSSSTQGVYLRDVKRRLMIVRGKGMPSSFSWSFKRRYKKGYVWQDLSDDDLILPSNGCEYVLKGCKINNADSSPSSHSKQLATARSQKDPLPLICPATKAHVINTSTGSNSLAKLSKLFDKNAEDNSFGGSQITSNLSLESDQITVSFGSKGGLEHTIGNHDESQTSRSIIEQKKHAEKGLLIANSQLIQHGEYEVFTKHGCPLVNLTTHAGADVATQTEEEGDNPSSTSQRLTRGSSLGSGLSCQRDPLDEIKQTSLIELNKGEISPPPCSLPSVCASSSSSASGKHKLGNYTLTEDQISTSPVSSCNNYNCNQASGESTIFEQLSALDTGDRVDFPPAKINYDHKGKKSTSNTKYYKASYKICSSSGFLQFVSCGGGLEVKDPEWTMSPAEMIPANHAIVSTNQGSKSDNRKKLSLRHVKGWANYNYKKASDIKSTNVLINQQLSPADLLEKQAFMGNNAKESCSRRCSASELLRSDSAPYQLSGSNRSSNASQAELIRYQCRRKSSSSACSESVDHHEWKSFPVFGLESLTEPTNYTISVNSLIKSASLRKSLGQPNAIQSPDYFMQLASSSKAKTNNAANRSEMHELLTAASLMWPGSQQPSQNSSFRNGDERPLIPPETSNTEREKAVGMSLRPSPDLIKICLQECLPACL